jgi:toxin ParE1/3/4
MARFRLSERATLDIEAILVFSIQQFGVERAELYKTALGDCMRRVANDPRQGRQLTGRAKNYLRYLCQRHVIFFSLEPDGILVVRILHSAMDHKRHLP